MKNSKKNKVLVVEDEPILSMALSIELSSKGYTVFTADNGEEGLKAIRKDKPEVVLLDLLMPVMDGFQVLEELKKDKSFSHLKVVVLTNLGQEEDEKKAKELGANHFFVKSATELSYLSKLVDKLIA